MEKSVTLITDGACIGNPGPGGWACILKYGAHQRELVGCEGATTNNRMELDAVIQGLHALKQPCEVHVITDSKYVKDGLTQWLDKWKRTGWSRKVTGQGRTEVKNRDLWEELDKLRSVHKISLEWVKGHAEHPDNNRCDYLATQAARSQDCAPASR